MFPNATIPERIADGTVHAMGVLGALTGAIMLLCGRQAWSASVS